MIHNEDSRVRTPALVRMTRSDYEYLSLKQYDGHICSKTNIIKSSN